MHMWRDMHDHEREDEADHEPATATRIGKNEGMPEIRRDPGGRYVVHSRDRQGFGKLVRRGGRCKS